MSKDFKFKEDLTDDYLLDDLLDSLSDWRSVPEIVRLTFKAISGVVKSQGTAIRGLEVQTATKANRSELAQKLGHSDFNRTQPVQDLKTLEAIQELLEEKATRKECQYMISSKFSEIKSDLDKKVDLRELQNELRALKMQIEEFKPRKIHQKEVDVLYKLIEEKASIREVSSALDEKISKNYFTSALNKKLNKADLEALMLSKADVSELQSLGTIIENKADRHELDAILQELSQRPEKTEVYKVIREEISRKSDKDLSDAITGVKKNFDFRLAQLESHFDSLKQSLDQSQNDFSAELQRQTANPDLSKFGSILKHFEEKFQRLDNGLTSLFQELSDLKSKINSEPVKQDFSKDLEKLNTAIKSTRSYLERYIDTRLNEQIHIDPSLFSSPSKHSLSEIYEALDIIKSELQRKPSAQDVLTSIKCKIDRAEAAEMLANLLNSDEHKGVIEILCGENCTARWIWKSGQLRAGYSVPWESESVNTCPENFIWEKDVASIVAVAPGLYEVKFGFFAATKPVVQLLINGEAVIVDAAGQGKVWGRHPEGNIVAASITDYLALPGHARICISYSGPQEVEGFLCLRKL